MTRMYCSCSPEHFLSLFGSHHAAYIKQRLSPSPSLALCASSCSRLVFSFSASLRAVLGGLLDGRLVLLVALAVQLQEQQMACRRFSIFIAERQPAAFSAHSAEAREPQPGNELSVGCRASSCTYRSRASAETPERHNGNRLWTVRTVWECLPPSL